MQNGIITNGSEINLFRQMMDAGYGNANSFLTNDAVSGGLAFLTGELARRDPKLRQPLTSIIWPRDIEAILGGGWIDFTEVEFADYGVSGPNALGLTGNSTTQTPVVSVNVSKDVYRVFNWQNLMSVGYIDSQKAQTVGRSLDTMLDTGIRLNYQKSVEQIVYQGWLNFPGLLNNTATVAAQLAVNGASGFPQWSTKNPGEIINDINTLMVSTVTASGYDLSGMATHILIPWNQYNYIATQNMNIAGNVSILTYLMENNIAKNQGLTLQIHPCRWCSGAGVGGTDRMFGYVNNRDKIQFDLPVPLSRVMTVPSVTNGIVYLTSFAAQIGVVKFLYPTTCLYVDSI